MRVALSQPANDDVRKNEDEYKGNGPAGPNRPRVEIDGVIDGKR